VADFPSDTVVKKEQSNLTTWLLNPGTPNIKP